MIRQKIKQTEVYWEISH